MLHIRAIINNIVGIHCKSGQKTTVCLHYDKFVMYCCSQDGFSETTVRNVQETFRIMTCYIILRRGRLVLEDESSGPSSIGSRRWRAVATNSFRNLFLIVTIFILLARCGIDDGNEKIRRKPCPVSLSGRGLEKTVSGSINRFINGRYLRFARVLILANDILTYTNQNTIIVDATTRYKSKSETVPSIPWYNAGTH